MVEETRQWCTKKAEASLAYRVPELYRHPVSKTRTKKWEERSGSPSCLSFGFHTHPGGVHLSVHANHLPEGLRLEAILSFMARTLGVGGLGRNLFLILPKS